MRYELNDFEWTAIKPMLPNKPRGVRRVNDRRVLNGIFWVLRSGAPRRDLPKNYGPYTTCYNRFVGRRRRERLLTMRVASKPGGAVLICPTGKSVNCLSSPICKNILVFARPKSNLYPSTSRPTEGRWPSPRTRGGMRWTRQRFARHVMAGWASACERSTAR
jgi:hypothetical protein